MLLMKRKLKRKKIFFFINKSTIRFSFIERKFIKAERIKDFMNRGMSKIEKKKEELNTFRFWFFFMNQINTMICIFHSWFFLDYDYIINHELIIHYHSSWIEFIILSSHDVKVLSLVVFFFLLIFLQIYLGLFLLILFFF